MTFEKNYQDKITFTCELFNGDTITYTCQSDEIDDLMRKFTEFLRGIGHTVDGYVDIVNDEYEGDDVNWEDDLEPIEQKNFNFDGIPKNNWPFPKVRPSETNIGLITPSKVLKARLNTPSMGSFTTQPLSAIDSEQLSLFDTKNIVAISSEDVKMIMEAPGTLGGARVDISTSEYQG